MPGLLRFRELVSISFQSQVLLFEPRLQGFDRLLAFLLTFTKILSGLL